MRRRRLCKNAKALKRYGGKKLVACACECMLCYTYYCIAIIITHVCWIRNNNINILLSRVGDDLLRGFCFLIFLHENPRLEHLNITRVDNGGGGGGGSVSGLLRRTPRIEMDHKATAADLIIRFVIGLPNSQPCVQGARGTTTTTAMTIITIIVVALLLL